MREGYVRGWKGIANHLGVSQSTAIRWSRIEGFPVLRAKDDGSGAVLAKRAELDAWLARRTDDDAVLKAASVDDDVGFHAAETDLPAPTVASTSRWPPPRRRAMMALLTSAVGLLVLAANVRTTPGDELPGNALARELFLEGREALGLRTPQSLRRAMSLLERSVTVDPLFAKSWVALADAHALAAEFSVADRDASFRSARDAVEHALTIDPDDPGAHRLAGFLTYWTNRDIEKAARYFERSFAADDRNALTHLWYGNVLIDAGQFDLAREHLDQASALAPDNPAIAVDRLIGSYQAGGDPDARDKLAALAEDYPRLSSIPGNLALFALNEDDPQGYLHYSQVWAATIGDPWQIDRVAREQAAFARGGRIGLYRLIADRDLARIPQLSFWHGGALTVAIAASHLGDRKRLLQVLSLMRRDGRSVPPLRFPIRTFTRWSGDAEVIAAVEAISLRTPVPWENYTRS